MGRFISFDPILKGLNHTKVVSCRKSITTLPIMQPQKLNPYLYVIANPIKFIDPSGEAPCPRGELQTQILAVGPIDAWIAFRLSQEATNLANTIGLPGIHNGKADAFRHCYWSCLMAQDIGVSQAQIVGDIHEDCVPNSLEEREMDTFNNTVGRSLGSSNCKDACKQAACGGDLKTLP